MIETPCKINLWSVYFIFATKDSQPMEIYTKIKAVWGHLSYSHVAVVERCRKCRLGRDSSQNLTRPEPTRVFISNETERLLQTILRANKGIRVRKYSQIAVIL